MRENELLPLLGPLDRVGRLPVWLIAVVVFALQVLAAIAAWHHFRVGPIAAVWPPGAIALAALAFAGWWMVPVILLADVAASALNGLPFAPVVSLGNLAAPLFGAILWRAMAPRSIVPQSLRDTVRLLLVVLPLVALVTTVFGLVYTLQTGVLRSFSPELLVVAWWLGDVLGLVAFAPWLMLVLARVGGLVAVDEVAAGAGRLEGAVVLLSLMGLALLPWLPVTGRILGAGGSDAGVQLVVQALLLLFVLMIWSALRLPALLAMAVVPLAALTGLKLSLIELTSHASAGDLLQWLVLLPTLLVMAVVALVIEAGAREHAFVQRRLRFQSEHDSLTGLLNRRAFELRVRARLGSADSASPWLLGYLDLDRFQVVNDTLGHTAGDELLVQLAEHLAAAVGPDEVVARLGGDEFGMLVRGPWQPQGRESIARVQQAIEAFRFSRAGQVYSLRASIGVTGLEGDPSDFGRLLSVADAACLSAKEQGRDRVHFSRGGDRVRRHIDELHKLPVIQDAMDQGRIELFGQPIVALDPERADERSLEVLCRLRDAEDRLIAPETFIGVAERSGLMLQIDRLVVARVLDWLARGNDLPERCFVNLSATSITNARFAGELLERIERSGIDPCRLVFEMTETVAVGNYAAARHLIERLRALGSGVALDDFGSGMSSFGHLHALPVDYVKIDALFVRSLGERPMNESIVRSIAQIGRDCGIAIIAEGVESAEALAILRRHGVDYAQGYHLGRPAPLADPARPPA
jgi:diguanylate cyclase (GGDEF)-like protein